MPIPAGSENPTARSRFFELWRRPDELADALAEDLREFTGVDALAVTMTGELADCFLDRAVGVSHIVQHTIRAAERVGVTEVNFYRVDGAFCSAAKAIEQPDHVAAANWHALASWVAREIAPDGLVIDVGSTTTDIVPVADGRVSTSAITDFERLREGSLVYVGCRRTPVCAQVDRLQFRGDSIPVMNEWFATIDDAFIILGIQPECIDDMDSADGKPRTIEMSLNRLARMIGLDHRDVSISDATEMAQQTVAAARERISSAVSMFLKPEAPVILCGHGHDLVDLPSGRHVVMLREKIGSEPTRCAPAYAVAKILQRQMSDHC